MNQTFTLVTGLNVLPTPVQFSGRQKLALVALGLALFGLGQFDEAIFAGLSAGWRGLVMSVGGTHQGVVPGLSTHALPVALSYRLLYTGVSVGFLHVALHGRSTKWLAGSYAVALTLSMGLLLVGQLSSLPQASAQAHRLLDVVCSPLALLCGYALFTLGHRPLVAERSKQLKQKPQVFLVHTL
jgi:hypothetical protein